MKLFLTHFAMYLTGAAVAIAGLFYLDVLDACPESMICYEPYGGPVTPEYINPGAVVFVRFLPPEEIIVDGEQTDGWSYSEPVVTPDGNLFTLCIIAAPMPEQVLGDPAMDTLGHELLHCLTGEFHP